MKTRLKFFTKMFVLGITIAAVCATDTFAATKKTTTATPSTQQSIIVNNKASKFSETLSDINTKSADTSSKEMADRVRRQRALLDNSGTKSPDKAASTTGANKCDSALRKCMAEKCGADFTKCASDSTAIWGDKMDSCRRKTECTGREYTLLAPEILADRDMNERMAYYDSVITCGNKYNSCIFTECGQTLDKCLSKTDGDRAVSKCESVARSCKEQDSGLAARVMTVFGDMRKVAMVQAEKDEKRLYELRDLMRNQCTRFGAMFDERTFDCVYTVNFFAGDDAQNPKASKKLYAGDTFQCNANWFGIDITTFKENAYRRTRAQTAASSAMLGAGVGTAVGLVTSGAVGRALDTQKSKKAAQQKCEDAGYTWEKGACNQDKPLVFKGDLQGDPQGDEGTGGEDPEKPATLTKEEQIQQNAQCLTYDNEDTCNSHSDSCEWTKSEDGIGECARKGSTPSKTNTEQKGNAQDKNQKSDTNTKTTTNVNLSFAVTDITTDPDNVIYMPARISCSYKNENGKKSTFKNKSDDGMLITGTVPSDADCTISTDYCPDRTAKASQLAGLKTAPLKNCNKDKITKCVDKDKCRKKRNSANITPLTSKQSTGVKPGSTSKTDNKQSDKNNPCTEYKIGQHCKTDKYPNIDTCKITSAAPDATGKCKYHCDCGSSPTQSASATVGDTSKSKAKPTSTTTTDPCKAYVSSNDCIEHFADGCMWNATKKCYNPSIIKGSGTSKK